MKVRLRKSDETFEATKWKHGACDVNINNSVARLGSNVFDTLFEPVPEPVDEVEKLAKVLFKFNWPESNWDGNTTHEADRYKRQARAVLAAGYLPPPEPKKIEVGSRVRFKNGGSDRYIVLAIDGSFAWLRVEANRLTADLSRLELIPEGDGNG